MLELGFWLHPAIPGWGVLGVCVCVRYWPVPRQSWLGCAVCVFGCGFWLHPANSGWVLLCVCMNSSFALTPPILAGVLRCVFLCAGPACTLPFPAAVCALCFSVRVSLSARHA